VPISYPATPCHRPQGVCFPSPVCEHAKMLLYCGVVFTVPPSLYHCVPSPTQGSTFQPAGGHRPNTLSVTCPAVRIVSFPANAMRYTHSFYALSILIVMVVTFVFIWHATEYPPMFSTGLYSPSILVKPTPVNITTVLTAELPHQKGLAFTKDDDNLNGFAVLGSPASYIELDDSKIIDIKTGEPVRDFNEGTTFNLAVLKLPHGSKWGFLGVARGPTRRREFMRLSGYESREQVLVA
jgi:hypothetical protein